MTNEKAKGPGWGRVAGLIVVIGLGWPSASFDWYWNDKAQVTPEEVRAFWHDDAISNWFYWASANVVVPAWNWLMRIDAIRYGIALAYGGIMAGLGLDLYRVLKRSV